MIHKIHKASNYTVVSNVPLKDNRLSLKALGLLVKVLSLPPQWKFSRAGLQAICKEQRDALSGAIKELKECGYLVISQMNNNCGKFETVYNWYEEPLTGLPSSGLPSSGLPSTDLPSTGLPSTENPSSNKVLYEQSTDILNTKRTTTTIKGDGSCCCGNSDSAFKDIVNLYQDNIQPLTGITAEKLEDLLDECGAVNVTQAIEIASEQNKRSFAYVRGVAHNLLNGTSKVKPKAEPTGLAAIDELLREMEREG